MMYHTTDVGKHISGCCKSKFKLTVIFLGITFIFCLVGVQLVYGGETGKETTRPNDLLQTGQFIQIPGPNPILMPGEKGNWDDDITETSDAFKDFGTYYLYYHGSGNKIGYQIGVATSKHPLGPFKKYEDNPILERGSAGSWDCVHVACALIMKQGVDKYYMWYSGRSNNPEHTAHKTGVFSIGLATASSPIGPWKKYEGNPIIEDFGYVGGVVFVKGKYNLYTTWPINATGLDYGPISLAIADKPEGPWVRKDKIAMQQGNWGEWDDGGFSESEVLYENGIFHMFYGGTKLYNPRMLSRESIGYAYSYDGSHFIKYGRNPVATRLAYPNMGSMSEVHAIIELPYIYLYHTLRYKEPWYPGDEKKFPGAEHIGVQVLATQTPFSIDMPILTKDILPAGATTKSSMDEAPPVTLSAIHRLALTAECQYSPQAKKGIRLHVRTSHDGYKWDTTDLVSLDHEFIPGQLCHKSFDVNTNARFIKVMVENLDKLADVSDIQITATLGS